VSQPSGGTETRALAGAPRGPVSGSTRNTSAVPVPWHRPWTVTAAPSIGGDAEGVDRAARVADRAARELDRAPGRVARERVRDLHRLPGDLDQVPRRECLDRLPDRGGQARDGLRDERGDRHGAARLDEVAPDGAQDRIGPLATAASPARQ